MTIVTTDRVICLSVIQEFHDGKFANEAWAAKPGKEGCDMIMADKKAVFLVCCCSQCVAAHQVVSVLEGREYYRE